jgi:hypothetical protein
LNAAVFIHGAQQPPSQIGRRRDNRLHRLRHGYRFAYGQPRDHLGQCRFLPAAPRDRRWEPSTRHPLAKRCLEGSQNQPAMLFRHGASPR